MPADSSRWLTATRVPLAAIAIITAMTCVADEAANLPGPELYRAFCASCHGPEAHGDGPVSSVNRPAFSGASLGSLL
jgi:mono/diheme cytochrome c family protein